MTRRHVVMWSGVTGCHGEVESHREEARRTGYQRQRSIWGTVDALDWLLEESNDE